jgi:hypothetical protein
MDSDKDGFISAENISIEEIQPEIVEALLPVFN